MHSYLAIFKAVGHVPVIFKSHLRCKQLQSSSAMFQCSNGGKGREVHYCVKRKLLERITCKKHPLSGRKVFEKQNLFITYRFEALVLILSVGDGIEANPPISSCTYLRKNSGNLEVKKSMEVFIFWSGGHPVRWWGLFKPCTNHRSNFRTDSCRSPSMCHNNGCLPNAIYIAMFHFED
ncbi:hypothetical protein CEXT_712371 [Caerostris extrusa]|uniref:Uncharacterized protein n=1 Tax=Caerostris extrusa TaxID=172846 RepID=A0AAV4VRS7_CAEEX|nr:hypothetical protein CEXT_712371 [Caerostris extrusa]